MNIEEGERVDEMGFGSLQLIQKPEDFCYGIDAVILADFAARGANPGAKIADLGTGTGAIPLILSEKIPLSELIAVEVQPDSARRAERNVQLNQLSHRIRVIPSDILAIPSEYFGTRDIVVSNPPYTAGGGGIQGKNRAKAIARHETTAKLRDFLQISAKLLKEKGDLYMVHRPARLVDLLFYGREAGLEAKELRMVAPAAGKSANIVLLHYVKNGGRELWTLPELQVYDEKGNYTEEIRKIYQWK
ncbi:MAG: methyltransferase [Anaerovoracaceae bacterium]